MAFDCPPRWRAWMAQHRADRTDPAADAADPLPGIFDLAFLLVSLARHPRSFIRALSMAPPRL